MHNLNKGPTGSMLSNPMCLGSLLKQQLVYATVQSKLCLPSWTWLAAHWWMSGSLEKGGPGGKYSASAAAANSVPDSQGLGTPVTGEQEYG